MFLNELFAGCSLSFCCLSFVESQLVSYARATSSDCGMKAEPLAAEGDEVTSLYNIRRVFSSFISAAPLDWRHEWRSDGEEERKPSAPSKIKQPNFQKITRWHSHSRNSHSPSQKYTHTHVFVYFFFLYVFLRVGWFWGGICLVWRCFGARCCFGSCVVSRRRRRQQPEQERKLHFRDTEEEEERGMRRRQRRRRSGGENTTVSASVSVFLYRLWRFVNKLRAGEEMRGGERERERGQEEEEKK